MRRVFLRELVELEPDKEPPGPDLLLYTPEGMRWETDDELRVRIKRTLGSKEVDTDGAACDGGGVTSDSET